MSGTDDLVAWLRDRLDERGRQLAEDERVAYASMRELLPVGYYAENAQPEQPVDWPLRSLPPATQQHVARHDPARVLAEVERGRRDLAGKRAVLDICDSMIGGWTDEETKEYGRDILRALVQEFEGEPGWREEWRA